MSSDQTKRTAECMSPLQERPRKTAYLPKVGTQDNMIELTILYAASGKEIAQLKVSKKSSVANLYNSVKGHLEPGQLVRVLLKGDTVLDEHSSLEASGVENGAKVKVIIASRPILLRGLPVAKADQSTVANVSNGGQDHVRSDDENSESSDESDDDDVNPGQDISKAPKVAREVAEAMMAAAPNLGCFDPLGGDEDPDETPGVRFPGGSEVIVIAEPGDDPKMACLQALKNDPDRDMPVVREFAKIEEADFSKHLKDGFNGRSKYGKIRRGTTRGVLAMTEIMSKSLEKHFHFGFSTDIHMAPHIWGGYASDGNIVGVKVLVHWSLQQMEFKLGESGW